MKYGKNTSRGESNWKEVKKKQETGTNKVAPTIEYISRATYPERVGRPHERSNLRLHEFKTQNKLKLFIEAEKR